LAFTEDVCRRYEAYGWQVQRVDGHDFGAIDQALAKAVAETKRPSLIAAKTIIGKGSPNKADTAGIHGSPLGPDELALMKEELAWPSQEEFHVPEKVRAVFAERADKSRGEYEAWKSMYKAWGSDHPELVEKLEKRLNYQASPELRDQLVASLPDSSKPAATRKTSSTVLQEVSRALPQLFGGSADLEPSTLTVIKDSESVTKECFSARNFHFGVREHAMGALMNGLAYYGGFIPFGSTFLCFADYMRPAIRLAALSRLQCLFIFTHDSVFLGEDGPTHQPVEHLASLRVIPNLHVFRPADGLETAVCYYQALARTDGPSALILTRQGVEELERNTDFSPAEIERGGYSVYESQPGDASPGLVMIATGSEVSLAVKAAKQLPGSVRVVSMPCLEVYSLQPEEYRSHLIPRESKRVVVEAAAPFAWQGALDVACENTLVCGIPGFGVSAPAKVIAEKMGFSAEQIAVQVKAKFQLE